jgi:4-amino-4-deoxy-L-arabinose transferase-like glycosyltransferase
VPPQRTLAACVGLGAVLAAVLRLSRLDLVEFKADEAQALRMSEDLVRLGHFPETGIMTSQGIAQAPHLMYVLAPVVALSREPAFATAAIACANVLTVLGTGWLAWRWFGPLAGASATLLYAVNPWAVFWSRKIWAQELLPPLALLLFVALDAAVTRPRRRGWAAAAYPIVALGVMIHYSMLVLAPLLVVPTVALLRGRRWLPLVLGVGAAVLVMLPFVQHEQRIAWVDYPTLRAEMARHPTVVNLEPVRLVVGLTTGLGADTLVGVPLARSQPDTLLGVAAGLATALLVLGLGITLAMLVRPSRAGGAARPRIVLVLAWLGLPIVATLAHSLDLHDHYYLLLYPAPFLLIGGGVGWLARQPARWAQGLLLTSLSIAVSLSALHLVVISRFVDDLGAHFEPCYDLPLGSTQEFDRDLLAFGDRLGSTRGTVELDEADAMPLAYVLRPHFQHLRMQRYGDIGLGPGEPSASGPIASGQIAVQVLGMWTPQQPVPDWRPRLATVWALTAAPSPNASVVWQLAIPDTGQTFSGVPHGLSDLAGQRMLSWFTFEAPRGLAPGTHDVVLRLLDTSGSRAAVVGEWRQPLQIGYTSRCLA